MLVEYFVDEYINGLSIKVNDLLAMIADSSMVFFEIPNEEEYRKEMRT